MREEIAMLDEDLSCEKDLRLVGRELNYGKSDWKI